MHPEHGSTIPAHPLTPVSPAAATLRPPQGSERLLVCRAVIRETHAMSSFVLEPADATPLTFRPGQHVAVEVEIAGAVHQRCYSISSAPSSVTGQEQAIHITVKREPGGLVSNWLHDHIRPGMTLRTGAPQGRFNMIDLPSARPLLLSGGSGITPLMSMLRWLGDSRRIDDVVLVHCCRELSDIAFHEELVSLERRHPGLAVHFVLSGETASAHQGGPRRLSAGLLAELVPDAAGRTAYVCGPEGFMKAAREAAATLGLAGIHTESFGGIAGPALPPDIPPADGPTGGVVTFGDGERTYACGADETILDAAAASGIWLNSSCRQGVCGSCRVMLLSGKVVMDALGGLSEEEKAQGWILSCCSRPDGPVSVEI